MAVGRLTVTAEMAANRTDLGRLPAVLPSQRATERAIGTTEKGCPIKIDHTINRFSGETIQLILRIESVLN